MPHCLLQRASLFAWQPRPPQPWPPLLPCPHLLLLHPASPDFPACTEILLEGRVSKAADVYAMGITMWEMYTGRRAFEGIPRALLGHQVTKVRAWNESTEA